MCFQHPSLDSISIHDGVMIVATSATLSVDASLVFELSTDGTNASISTPTVSFGDGARINASGDVSIIGDALVTGGFVCFLTCLAWLWRKCVLDDLKSLVLTK